MKTTLVLPWWCVLGPLLMACSCRDSEPTTSVALAAVERASGTAPEAGKPAALQPFQLELLRTAFAAASKFPLDPHHKNRSRAQEVAVAAAFELDQPELAIELAADIRDWRRGCAHADYAWVMATRGRRPEAEQHLKLARQVQQGARDDQNGQEWRGDMIALKMSRAYAALGDREQAAAAAAAIDVATTHAVDASWAQTAAERVRLLPPELAAKELAELDLGFPTMTLGQQGTALALMARLHERFFTDAPLRAELEQRLTVRYDKVMPALRLDALATMVRTSVARGERDGARALVAAARGIVTNHRWRAEDRLPQAARLCELQFLVGDADRAKVEAEQALGEWHREREQIIDIFRAESLRPLALAWHTMGEADLARDLLAQVLEEGMENPNSRPRCDDLVDTLVAMAVRGIDPTASLWPRIREIVAGLGEPW
ncbi:MAG: hypothetical protein MUC36_05535 [Planctomycetes bacterium]|nr:hypothetical protein [Planctomycetota bacterium]